MHAPTSTATLALSHGRTEPKALAAWATRSLAPHHATAEADGAPCQHRSRPRVRLLRPIHLPACGAAMPDWLKQGAGWGGGGGHVGIHALFVRGHNSAIAGLASWMVAVWCVHVCQEGFRRPAKLDAVFHFT